jgi:hypothetical protein
VARWFTRSWTLPELLAPDHVDFFTSRGDHLGDKFLLLRELNEVTGIPSQALVHYDPTQFTVAERMSWASSRSATIEEDKVYSLLGMVNVYMPLIYGEGLAHALRRLKEQYERYLPLLPPSIDEVYPTTYQDQDSAPEHLIVDLDDESEVEITPDAFYKPLIKDGFRLLELDPGQIGSTITGHLEEFSLLDPPPYMALSYVWGQEPTIQRVLINSEGKLIRPNLFHALQRVRSLQQSRFRIWTDSLCIDQQNDTERNVQVGLMSQIYNKADAVFIWLGEENSTSQLAIELVDKIHEGGEEVVDSLDQPQSYMDGSWWKDYGFTALSRLLERQWFRRGWVLQEAAFSTNSLIQCGDRQVHMNKFAKVAKIIRRKISDEPRLVSLVNDQTRAGTLMNFVDSPAMRMLDLIEGAFERSTKGVIINPKMSLETLVYMSTFSETSNERDTIFALLNMANNTSSTLHSTERPSLLPDYRKSILEVYSDFVRHCCYHARSLDILCRPWAPSPSPQLQTGQSDGQQLPSWICVRDNLPYGDPSWRLKHRLHANPLVGDKRKQMYNAHNGTEPVAVIGLPDKPDVISARGIILTEVSRQSSRMANAIVTTECLDILEWMTVDLQSNTLQAPNSLWPTLCADRDEKGDPAPDSYGVAMHDLMKAMNPRTAMRHMIGLDPRSASIDIEELLESDISEHIKSFLSVVRNVVWNRRTFEAPGLPTEDPLRGLVPRNARVGDRICILYGCSVPVVLRKHEISDKECYWKLIGDAYVHGVMDGEAIRGVSDKMLRAMEMEFEIR